MDIISKHYGYILVFDDKNDLESTVKLLQGQLNFVEENNVKAPHLIAFYTDEIANPEYVQEELKNIKKLWTAASTSS